MTGQPERANFAADSLAAPLRPAVFRRIWLASLLSNLGLLIQGVGAAWAMTQMATSADDVALVQTALMLPIMLISMPAGAIADMYDRRIVALVSLGIALSGATALSVLAWLHLITPQILLAFCFVVGSGMALFGPAWQSSVSEQVPAETLPSAVALNGISYNIARSFGPAIGGIVVATAGAVAAFAANAVLYIPLLIVLFLWRRTSAPSRLPRERLNRAMVAGAVWMLAVALFNIGVQLSAPRWVAGRSLAAFQAAIAGGIAIGSWGWGRLTDAAGVETALLVSGALMFVSPLIGLWLHMPPVGARDEDAEVLADPEVRLMLTGRSGPLVVEIEYRVDQENARAFHNVMQEAVSYTHL